VQPQERRSAKDNSHQVRSSHQILLELLLLGAAPVLAGEATTWPIISEKQA
jgi:hypothetical protein